jgi:lysophospholipase L1-like esterase
MQSGSLQTAPESRSFATKLSELAAALDGQNDVKALATAAVMATPPTFSYSATTTLAGSSLAANNDPRFRFTGAETFTGNVAGKNFTLPSAPTGFGPVGSTASDYLWRVEFDFDGSDFELIARCSATAKWRLWVDGQPHAASPVNYTITDNTAQFMKVSLGSRAYRKLVFEGEGNWYFGGIQYLPTDTVAPPSSKRGPRLALVGDSYAVGSQGGNQRGLSYVPKMARLLGCRDFTMSTAAGGTGLIAPGSYVKYQDRLGDVTRIAPDIIIIQGTLNDGAQTAADVKAAAIAYVNAVRSALPNALVVICGTLYAATPGTTYTAHSAALNDAATDRGVPFINPIGWFTGTGNNTAPASNGNADYYRASDGAHPSPLGHDYIANRMAGAMRRVLRGDMVAS